jgi:hypothetical protein
MSKSKFYAALAISLLIYPACAADTVSTPEQLIQNLTAAAKARNTERFLSYLTSDSHKAIDEWLKVEENLERARENFQKALDERFPESRTNVVPAQVDFTRVLSLISALELVSQNEQPGGELELRLRTSRQIPGGQTLVHEDPFLAQKENGEWKLKIDPGPVDGMLRRQAAFERVTAAVQHQDFSDRPSAIAALRRMMALDVPSRPIGIVALGSGVGAQPQTPSSSPNSNTVITAHPTRARP